MIWFYENILYICNKNKNKMMFLDQNLFGVEIKVFKIYYILNFMTEIFISYNFSYVK